jgi:hypothetical protein
MLPPLAPAAHLEVRDVVQWCFSLRSFLSSQDQEFLEGVARQLKPLSAKQQKWLRDICQKLERGSMIPRKPTVRQLEWLNNIVDRLRRAP